MIAQYMATLASGHNTREPLRWFGPGDAGHFQGQFDSDVGTIVLYVAITIELKLCIRLILGISRDRIHSFCAILPHENSSSTHDKE